MDIQDGKNAALNASMDLILDSPALSPPPGIQPNFANPSNHGNIMLGTLITCLVIVVTMTLMRLYVKLLIVKKIHPEDYFLLIALAFEIGHFAPALHMYTYDPILHQWDMPVRNQKKFLLDFQLVALFYALTILTLKFAILQQFLRVFIAKGDRSITFWTTHIVIWMNTIFYIIIVFFQIFACRPIAKAWDPLFTPGKCLSHPAQYLICASFNFALDATVMIWTQKVIWSLNMPNARKLGLGVLFLAGIIAFAFGGMLVYMAVRLMQTKDQAYIAATMVILTYPETASGFLVLCLPVLPKFVGSITAKMFPKPPTVFRNIHNKLFSKRNAAPHAYPAREDERGNRRQRRSLWYISTNASMSKSDAESMVQQPIA